MDQPQPPKIKKLDETVVNRIAAGEVIQRPSNALKELLENSLDAKSTSIQVTVKQGGLKLLQIQDNGTGIRKEDMEIVCERFTTSKLTQFEDLASIATFGFRGEALASISHVAHLTIITKTKTSPCAYRGSYIDSKLKDPIKACAGNQGTQIIAEDLFYNIPTRRKALKSPSEEYHKIAEVVSRYAVHNPHVGFTLKKQNENLAEIRTRPNSSHSEVIGNIYGNNIARELLAVEGTEDTFKLKVSGWVTNVNFSTKKMTFLLFINHRLVDSLAIKRMIEQVYSLYLPKGSFPFVYLSLCMDPKNVDVNVHPTKHEVHFLHEDTIIERVQSMLEKTLLGSNTSRVFYTQTKLPSFSTDPVSNKSKPDLDKTNDNTLLNPKIKSNSQNNVTPAYKMVRTDALEQKLDRFLSSNGAESNVGTNQSKYKRRDIKLSSVKDLRAEIEKARSSQLMSVFRKLSFVGCATPCLFLIQHDIKLYIVNLTYVLDQLSYQLLLHDFGNFGVFRFEEPISIKELLLLALDLPDSGWDPASGSKPEVAEAAAQFLATRADMLMDYFSLEIDADARLCTLPQVLGESCSMLMLDYVHCLKF
uniref:DNA mismatch repair protein MLH1 n=1 Tax=Cacopsylla melanoneura TaxID=428564 RepID=A0A8D8LUC9_9HEMI